MPRASKASTRAVPGLPSSTFILDNGAYSIKAGFAPPEAQTDEETLSRCHSIPNALARTRDKHTYVGSQIENRITQWSEVTFRRPVERGQLVNWEAQKEIWDLSFFDSQTARSDLLVKQPEDTTLILTEAPNTMPALQKNADEIIMEEWGFGAYSRVVGTSLNAYNDLHPLFGDPTPTTPGSSLATLPLECLLVIDSGFSHTIVTPIYNGRPLQRAIRRLDFGGKHLTNLLKEVISTKYVDLHENTKIVNDIKADACFVSDDFREDIEKTGRGNRPPQPAKPRLPVDEDAMEEDQQSKPSAPFVDYVLPDGVHRLRGYARPHDPFAASARKRKLNALAPESDEVSMTLGNELFTIPEIIFTPSDLSSKQPGLADCVMQSLSVLPPLIQATMLANTLVVGGTAKMPGFVERLQSELRMRARADYVVRVRKMDDPISSTWLGGARMAGNRAVVREYAVTRDEYLEHGSLWVGRKFAGLGN